MSIEYSVADHVATVRLNRPSRRNAFTIEMVHAWADALHRAQQDDDVRAVVLTGAGDDFCSGVDLDTLAGVDATPLARKQMLTENVHRVARAVQRLDKPLIAAMRGFAVGAGLDMALMCDVRFAGRSARLSTGYIRVGLVPGDGGCYFLPRLVGVPKALELLWTGDFVGAEEAHRIGLVNHVHADDVVVAEALAFAGRLAAAPPIAIRIIKRATYQSARADLDLSLDLISSHMAVVQSTEDSAEALSAFRERRTPSFQGR